MRITLLTVLKKYQTIGVYLLCMKQSNFGYSVDKRVVFLSRIQVPSICGSAFPKVPACLRDKEKLEEEKEPGVTATAEIRWPKNGTLYLHYISKN